jgi:hypothetical protein
MLRELIDALKKSWVPSPGTVTPFASSSSQHSEPNDNHLEHYVKTFTVEGSPSISSMFTSDLFSEGGEKVTAEKTFDIGESATTDNSYVAPTNSTEPDPLSNNAMQKADVPSGADDVDGKNAYSTTANTTTDAPSAGDTTEPVEKAEMEMCKACGQAISVKKTDDGDEDDIEKANDSEDESKEPAPDEENLEKPEMKKSFWAGSFAPNF